MSDNGAEGGTGRNDDAGRNGTIVPARYDSNRRLVRSEELGEQLLPGLPNEITLDLITPKLPWKEISTMSSVSRAWQGVIRSHEVYDARVRSHSTEEFVLINRYLLRRLNSIALYSPREKKCCDLPPIPHLSRGFPSSCQCVSLHGKIYVLGGEDEFSMGNDMGWQMGCVRVYVLDLYGQRQWKECASMEYPRVNFGCGVLDGNIYVFGGFHFEESLQESEMYDPEVDAWFPTNSLPYFRSHQRVATVGEELLVYGGVIYDEVYKDEGEDGLRLVSGTSAEDAFFLEMYNPEMDEWFGINSFLRDTREQVVLARGKLYSISLSDIHVYDMEENSWTLSHTCSFPGTGPPGTVTISFIGAVAVDDELLLRVSADITGLPGTRSRLLQSRGFGSENKTIVWDFAKGYPSFEALSRHCSDFMSLAEL